jgi:hypothetical protein
MLARPQPISQKAINRLLDAILTSSIVDAAKKVIASERVVSQDAFQVLLQEIGRARGVLLRPCDPRRSLSHSARLREALKRRATEERIARVLDYCGGVPKQAAAIAVRAIKEYF